MEKLKVIVSGSFKEKALLLSVIGDALKQRGLDVYFKENFIDTCARNSVDDDCLGEVQRLNLDISLELENLQNTNTVEDLTKLYEKLVSKADGNEFNSTDINFLSAIDKVSNNIRQILLL